MIRFRSPAGSGPGQPEWHHAQSWISHQYGQASLHGPLIP